MLTASTLALTSTTHAATDNNAPKGTMGSGYQQYMAKHPEKAKKPSQSESNRSLFRSAQDKTTSSGERVLDISEWQGNLTQAQVKQLKKNYDFIIIRAQYGSEYVDKSLEHNSYLLDKNGMKFGVYSYSMYENPQDARYEAQTLYNRAPKASFYVNDFEQNSVTSGTTDEATSAWHDEMKRLAGNKKILLYSYENFMLQNASIAVSDYDGFWLAAYTDQQPTREKVLWQYTDSYYSPELQQNVDASYLDSSVNAKWFTN
ncbi:GH25 family lysozyme [Staphylococcus sp. SQ8-PEA]|uniref:GH25 family lysozyme n=1 Tax=Staphylococcus marylandisciuri TaxID=2981529 RepID=A0ABT2QR77_9STAP|nr:GH25 family lysozyme [Staphylococcus marylandisciuri]MCU5746490.1 GH25 family lysozyme [Staphylococcus marylandisciuri]